MEDCDNGNTLPEDECNIAKLYKIISIKCKIIYRYESNIELEYLKIKLKTLK